MNKLATAAALLALLPVTGIANAAAAGRLPSAGAQGGRAIVLAGGMSAGSGGMGGGGGGMGGGATGMHSGAFGMGGGGGHFGGGMFGGPTTNFDQPAAAASDQTSNAPPDNYTYQCITPAGRCSFVAPAALRANSLRSGADCGCGGGQPQGRIE